MKLSTNFMKCLWEFTLKEKKLVKNGLFTKCNFLALANYQIMKKISDRTFLNTTVLVIALYFVLDFLRIENQTLSVVRDLFCDILILTMVLFAYFGYRWRILLFSFIIGFISFNLLLFSNNLFGISSLEFQNQSILLRLSNYLGFISIIAFLVGITNLKIKYLYDKILISSKDLIIVSVLTTTAIQILIRIFF